METNILPDQQNSSIRVAVTLPVKETYDYTVPGNLQQRIKVGCRVRVPFRNRKVIGYIIEINPVDQERRLKSIISLIDQEPLFHEDSVRFFQWAADYYLYPIGKLIESALPSGLNPGRYIIARLTHPGKKALELLSIDSPEREILTWVRDNPKKRFQMPMTRARALVKRGWLELLVKKRRAEAKPLIRLFVTKVEEVDLEKVFTEKRDAFRAKNEKEFIDLFLQDREIQLRDIQSRFSNGSYLVGKWVKKGVLEKVEKIVFRDPVGKEMFPSPEPEKLFEQQEKALSSIQEEIDRKRFASFMLYGVTGSGKTEVYCRAIRHAISKGRQAILLVPEIALAVYLEGLLRSRIGARVAIYHSGLSKGERFDQWMRIVRGEADLVIGARSALFAPLPRLGLIIVDEEHDFSYKQDENPRYHARDAAVVRGKMGNAVLVLGSGTPSIQTYHNGITGRYKTLEMPHRIENRPLPVIETVDMKKYQADNNAGFISPKLRSSLDETINQGKQAILFLNRRGYHRIFLCRHCGESIRCYNCDLSLVHHLKDNRLSCHYCGFQVTPDDKCPTCGRNGIRAYGFGTEKLEAELNELYPDVRIARIDRDSTRRKGRTFDILKKFSDQEIDILVGTQMITKGYDFPNVTLVGVIAADFSLGFPDFRAGERTFQILSQVAGRAGRGAFAGRVIVQSFNPEHYAITTAQAHDYKAFYEKEKDLRNQLGYPPFSYLACMRLQGNSLKKTEGLSNEICNIMTGILEQWPKRGKEITVLGPAEAPLSKLKGKYRWQIFVKSKGSALLHYYLKEVEQVSIRKLRASGVTMKIDVDPYQML